MNKSSAHRLVGQPVERSEDIRFLTGRGTFVGDLHREDMLTAVILRSNLAHGRIIRLDASAALARPGVRAVLTAADIAEEVPKIPLRLASLAGFERYLQPVIARERVRYVGEPLAVIIAETGAAAEDALEAIEVEIESLPAVPDRHAAEAGTALLFDETGGNVATRYTVATGDPDLEAVFAKAPYARRENFRVHRHTALPLETRGLVAEWDAAAGRLTVSGATKVTFFNRRVLARMLGIDEQSIELVEVDVGGGFGVRGEFYPEDFLIPFAARALGRPVKWIEDRREHLVATNHSREIDCELEIACARDGTIRALRGRIWADMGAYIRTNGGVVPAKAAQFLHGPYRIANFQVEVTVLMTSKTPVGTYRGPGRFEANFFRERLIDMAAHDLGIDPVTMRRRNLIGEAEMPYEIGRLVPYESAPAVYDTGDFHATLDRCVAEISWHQKQKLQGRLADGRYHGIGIACFVESGGAGPKESARLVLEADGSVAVYVGSCALGQGLETVFAQVAADALDLPFDRFRVFHGSTSFVAEGFGTYHSRAAVMGGSAVLDGAAKLVGLIREIAGARLGVSRETVLLADGHAIAADGRRLSFAEIGAAAHADGAPLAAEGTFANAEPTYTYGAHAAQVAVDPKSGHVDIIDYVAVEDVGRAVNPAIVHGQAIGALVQGLGGVFLDHLIYDREAQLVNASLADYLVPTAGDFPNVRAVTLEIKPSLTNPLGAKGAGEGGIVAVAAAVGNAVAAALAPLGVEPNALPLAPACVWRLIEDARLSAAKE